MEVSWDVSNNTRNQPLAIGNFNRQIAGWWFQTFETIFRNIWDVILHIDDLIFFKMGIAPPTRYIYI